MEKQIAGFLAFPSGKQVIGCFSLKPYHLPGFHWNPYLVFTETLPLGTKTTCWVVCISIWEASALLIFTETLPLGMKKQLAGFHAFHYPVVKNSIPCSWIWILVLKKFCFFLDKIWTLSAKLIGHTVLYNALWPKSVTILNQALTNPVFDYFPREQVVSIHALGGPIVWIFTNSFPLYKV